MKWEFDDYVVSEDMCRMVRAKDDSFHMFMRKKDGVTLKWGKTPEEDPMWCPFGPELLDIEVTTICNGIQDKDGNNAPCPFCYKSNTVSGENMSLETFKNIFDKITAAKTLNQIAFGADASLQANPELFAMFKYCRDNGVTPNVTCADISWSTAAALVGICGAVAVSWYPLRNKERCYDSVSYLVKEKEAQKKDTQINIHALLSTQTLPLFDELIHDVKTDERLKGLKAVVILSLKKKGRGTSFDCVSQEDFEKLMDKLRAQNIPFGMDSCSAAKFLDYLDKNPTEENRQLKSIVESCESFMWSSYINVKGVFYPCSFMEGEGEWRDGIDVTKINSFKDEVWLSDRGKKWRSDMENCLKCKGHTQCPYYQV